MANGAGWSLEKAIIHLERIIELNDQRYSEHFAANKEAVLKAEQATEKRFDGVNEFRNALGDQQRSFIPRSEVDVIVRGVMEKVSSLEKQLDALTAERKGVVGGWGYAAGVVGFLLAIGSLILIGLRFVKGN